MKLPTQVSDIFLGGYWQYKGLVQWGATRGFCNPSPVVLKYINIVPANLTASQFKMKTVDHGL